LDNDEIDLIVSLCDYLLVLIEDLNCFVQMDDKLKKSYKNNFTQIDIKKLLDFCLNIYKTRQNFEKDKKPYVSIKSNYDITMPTFICSNEKNLKQVIVNLLSNGYKFTNAGELSLETKCKTRDNKNFLEISVRDTGTGISKEELKFLFQPFHVLQRNQIYNPNGSGLGLLIISDLLKELETEIKIKSEINQGSIFSFELEIGNYIELIF